MRKITRFLGYCSVGLCFLLQCGITAGNSSELVEKSITVQWNPVLGGGYRGVWDSGKGMELISNFPLPKDTVLSIIEAEDSSAILFNEGGGIRKDGTASGGIYAASPKTVEIFLSLEKPADYDFWYHARFADNTSEVKFLQGIDASLGGNVGWVTLKKEKAGWQWFKCPIKHTFKRAGMLEVQMGGIPPGLEIDQFVLASDPQWKPEQKKLDGATVLRPEPWIDGILDTGDLFFPQVDKWGKVLCGIDKKQGNATFQYSLDGGKTWINVPSDGELGSVTAKGDGSDRIRFKIGLHRKKGELSSLISSSLKLTYFTTSDSVYQIQDSTSSHYFSRKTGALCGIMNKKTGHALTPLDYPAPIFTLCLKKPGFQDEKEWETLSSLEAKCTEAGVEEQAPANYWRKIRFSYQFTRKEGTINVTVQVSFKDPGESLWECEATNNLEGLEICKLIYPVLDKVRIGDDIKDNTLLINGSYLVKNPAMFGHFLYWWPGTSYPMMDVSNSKEGISLIAHDTSLRCTGISCLGQQDSVQLRLHKIVDVKKGQTFKGAPNLVRIHQGDWHDACLLERPWANQAFPLVDSPLWAEELDVFATAGWPVPPWNQWGKMADNIRNTTQAPLLGVWNFQIPGTCWTVPHPNPILGDAEDLSFAVREVQKKGIRIIMYIQSLLADRFSEGSDPEDMIGYIKRKNFWKGWELPEKGFMDKYRIRDAGGKEISYNATSDDRETAMNQASSGFQNYKYHWAFERFGEILGLNGIYWDSDSGQLGMPAWGNSDLYNFDPGMTGKGAQDTQRKIRSAFQKSDPSCVFVGEGPANVMMGGVRDFTLDNVESMWPFHMLFPKMKILLGSANGADPKRRKAFLAGVRFDGIDMKEKLQEDFLWMRRQVKQYLYSADFRDDLGLTIKGEGIEAKLFALDPDRNDGVMFNVLNEKNISDGSLIFTPPGGCAYVSAWIVDSDHHDQKFTQLTRLDTGEYKISLPAVAAAHILLFNQLEPRAEVSCGNELAAGGKINIKLKLRSLDGFRKRGDIVINAPEGFTSERVPYDINADEAKELDIPLSADIGTPSRITDFPITITSGSVEGSSIIRALAFWRKDANRHEFKKVYSAYVQDPVEASLDWCGPEKLRIILKNLIDTPCSGSLSLASAKGNVKLAEGDFKIDYILSAKEKKEIFINLSGAEKTQEPWAFRGELLCRSNGAKKNHMAERKIPIYQRFWPVVPNGSMELFRFREGAPEKEHYEYSKSTDKMQAFEKNVPDYWWGILSDRSPQLSTIPGISIDNQDAGDGTRSLKLLPDTIFGAFVPIFLVKDRTYRFRMKMKWSAPSQRNYVAFVVYKKEGGALSFGKISIKPDAEIGKWHQLEETFKSQADSATLYFYSGKGTTTWFDDISVVPLDGEGTSN